MKIILRVLRRILPASKSAPILRRLGVQIGDNCEIYKTVNFGSEPYLIKIGNHVRINAGVNFVTHDGGCWVLRDRMSGFGEKFSSADCFGKIVIDDNVHIGTNAIVMPGVHIGKNCIVACGAIVTRDVPDNSIVAGIPARVIESLDEYANKMDVKYVTTKNLSRKDKEKFLKQKYSIEI